MITVNHLEIRKIEVRAHWAFTLQKSIIISYELYDNNSEENSTQIPNGIMLPNDSSRRKTAKAISTATIVGKIFYLKRTLFYFHTD